jgi:hypothetical protein
VIDETVDITRPTWCAGCDQLRPPLLMGWTSEGAYRCVACRGADVYLDPDGKGLRLWAKLSSVGNGDTTASGACFPATAAVRPTSPPGDAM